jgi:hypothetical protein
MNAEFEDVVRDSMSQFTDEVTLPADLADRARRHVRRQRQARMGGLTATVVACVTAMLVVTAAGQAHPSRPNAEQTFRAQLTAKVIRHVVRALVRTASTNPIEYSRQTVGGRVQFSESTPIQHLTFQIRVGSIAMWRRGGVWHSKIYSLDGRLIEEAASVPTAHGSSTVTIEYPRRIWWRDTYRSDGPLPTGPVTSCVLDVEPYWTTAQWASQLRALVSCPNVQVQGRQWVNGVDAIRIETHTKRVRTCGILTLTNGTRKRQCEWGIAGWPGTLLINPKTYLPIRYVYHGRGANLIDFGFLPPNRANLAKLRMAIPPGFRRA